MLCTTTDVERVTGITIKIVLSGADLEEGGGQGVRTPEKYRVSYQYWSGFPENHKTTKPAFNVGPS